MSEASERRGHLLPEGGYATCDQCAYWEQTTKTGGDCRRRSPAVFELHGLRSWPETGAWSWCGEFARKVIDARGG